MVADAGYAEAVKAGGNGEPRQAARVGQLLLGVDTDFRLGRAGSLTRSEQWRSHRQLAVHPERGGRGSTRRGEQQPGGASHASSYPGRYGGSMNLVYGRIDAALDYAPGAFTTKAQSARRTRRTRRKAGVTRHFLVNEHPPLQRAFVMPCHFGFRPLVVTAVVWMGRGSSHEPTEPRE